MMYKSLKRTFALGFLSLFLAVNSQAVTPSSVVVAWEPNAGAEAVSGYRVHYGTRSGSYDKTIDVGANVKASVNDLVAGNTYYFVVTAYNTAGFESSPSQEISHAAKAGPRFDITSYPASKVATKGSTLTLSVTASSSLPVTYQWQKNSKNISGATQSSLTIADIKQSDVGIYSVTVSESSASETTPGATVSLVQMTMPKKIVIDGVPGADYTISYSEKLAGNNWAPLTNVTLDSNQVEWTDVSATNSDSRFYQITPAE